ncbi:hypothetical protein NO559_06400 [Dasania sp. GY-MA-18]|uniref:Pyrroloquinoline quinone biosynthesis protein PqqE n=1 Tax=Dasania phycosphaerae TaxID=2950436 RepID=A0A9J6RKV7_9GAMM|nr:MULTISPECIES: hypothetical protein [Dasania]MCR8922395.1 hypothetical protein [Dasania sp. GY-MA-18]MCZ0864823.1 hypothetical protein [Dasania phycosphaerae]MCZ0868551.1 hypothetical protein [Dasania phycosphaerae]
MNPVLSTGLAGIQAGQNSAQSAAQKIASASVTTPTDTEAVDAVNEATAPASSGLDAITEGAVELLRSEQQVQASAAVVQTADETLGTLIDTVV